MRLIGMLDSPYLRRVAVSFAMMDIPFQHESLSVFRDFEAFHAINPAVKAPTLVTDDGQVLMDSSLILEYASSVLRPARSLMPSGAAERSRYFRILGLALAACEKSVQIAYELNLRTGDQQSPSWLKRVATQLRSAYATLEAEIAATETDWIFGQDITQADITTAITWGFSRSMVASYLDNTPCPAIERLAERAERLEVFRAWPAS